VIRLIVKLSLTAAAALAGAALLVASPEPARPHSSARTILFVGNSFTYGSGSPVARWRSSSVTDLNDGGVGGVPALFKRFTEQAGLNYEVSLETAGGRTLQWHFDERRDKIDRAWDTVVLQEFSVLDPNAPGNPALTIDYATRLTSLFAARNPKVAITLAATWTRPDQTYVSSGHWYGKPVTAMALDVRHGMDKAAAAAAHGAKVSPVGEAFNCAIAAGLADPDPYNGISPGQIDLWNDDHYHGSTFGYYLEALTLFATVTGKDPRSLGAGEKAAAELGITPAQALALQRVAWATTHGQTCDKALLAGTDQPH